MSESFSSAGRPPTGSFATDAGRSFVIQMRLVGFLDAAQMHEALGKADEQLARGQSARLLVDCTAMDDYERKARELFTEWNARTRDRIDRVAVITDKMLWHMVVRTISLASKQTLRPFSDFDEGLAWLRESAQR